MADSVSILPNSDVARDIAHVLHPNTNLEKHQVEGATIITHGQGIYVVDETGKKYIEAMSGLWCASLGFNETSIADAVHDQMTQLPFYHGFAQKAVLPTINVAQRLKEMAPFEASKVFFTNSGSEANDSLIKIIWYYNNALGRPEKKKIIARKQGYHGVTIFTGSLTGMPIFRSGFDQIDDVILHTDCPHHYRYANDGETESEFSTRLAANLEKMILAEGPDTIAAFIAEPVMGAGGVIPPPEGYFQKIQAVLKRYDILMIADEVICGFGRTGNMFGSETFGIEPDAMTIAKQLSSGYLPIAAIILPEFIYDVLVGESEKRGVFAHGFTYGGHPVPAAAAQRTLELMEERDILGHVRSVSPVFKDALAKLADHPMVGETRCVGLIGAIELVSNKAEKTSFDAADGVISCCLSRCQELGLITRASGSSFLFCPPLIIAKEEIGEMFSRFEHALNDTYDWARRSHLMQT